MDCKDFKDLLIPMLKDQYALDSDEAIQVQNDFYDHMMECQSCKNLYDFAQMTSSLQEGKFRSIFLGDPDDEEFSPEKLAQIVSGTAELEASKDEVKAPKITEEEYLLLFDLVMRRIQCLIHDFKDKKSEDYEAARKLVDNLFLINKKKYEFVSRDPFAASTASNVIVEYYLGDEFQESKTIKIEPIVQSAGWEDVFKRMSMEREDYAPLDNVIDSLKIKNEEEKLFILNAYALFLTLQNHRRKQFGLV